MGTTNVVRRGWAAARGVGTRGGVGWLAAMVIGLATVLLLLAAGDARAGLYRVAQCGWGVAAELDPTYPATEGTAFSLNSAACSPPPGSGPAGMRFEGGIAPDGVLGLARARWVAPPGTSFRAAHLTWAGSPQPGNWQGIGVDVGGEFHLVASTFTSTAPTPVDLPITGQAWAIEAFLQCFLDGPVVGCTRSTASSMRLGELTLTVEDPQPPTVQLSGALLAPGWRRGTAAFEIGATDAGAGVAGEVATIDGVPALAAGEACAVQVIEGETRGTKLQPCPPKATRAVAVDMSGLADGAHVLHACATDFSGGQGCAPDARFEVDNSPPTISFTAAAEGQVAATVSDRYSGPASGTISVRSAATDDWTDLATDLDRDGDGTATLSARLPDLGAGAYFFRAIAADAVGNVGMARLRVAGTQAQVRHQAAGGHRGGGPRPRRHTSHLTVHLAARAGASRSAPGSARASSVDLSDRDSSGPRTAGSRLTVDYGTAAAVHGRLTDGRGAGIAGRPVAITVRAAAGLGAERHRLLTDAGGRFELRLPAGTSRHLSVAFHGGGGLAPAPRRSLTLRVRAGVSLTGEPAALRTGESVRLRGRVRLGPAHVSGRDKLIAIQYLERATKRWRPALVVRTDAKGRFDTSYRFRYVTGIARIRLRATAPAEGGWPFARGSSSPVTITVSSG
jgi:hypothetical protein